ncbi:DUF515 domain-containing protein [Methanothermococcus sp. SCGC AD-155-C09]|nr:DUF515 domain-containing protein [Methanothermococcus sp. SCGC AD-155-C09]
MVEDIDKGTFDNENRDYTNKLKKLKGKRASKSDSKKYIYLLLVVVVVLGLSFIGFSIYNNMIDEANLRITTLENAKEEAINTINQMFSQYPGDPQHTLYVNKIENCKSINEVNKVLDEVSNYIRFIEYKNDVINDIKNAYGPYYEDSFYAKTLVYKIKNTKSKNEVDNIIKNANIEENAKKYYINEIENSVAYYNYYRVPIYGPKRLISGKELLNYVKKLSLTEIKNINITPVSFNRVAIVVSGTQCGKIPYEGSKIEIYNKNNASVEPILGIINSSYVIVSNIDYMEFKNVSNILSEDGYTTSVISISNITYNMTNVPGILYATAADRLDYNKIKDKFGRYGEKLNKIQEDTQIFDEKAKYLLVLSVPSDSIPDLISMKAEEIYIVNVE